MPLASRIMPTQDFLRQCLDYDQNTGVLTWRRRDDVLWDGWNARYAGKIAGRQIGAYWAVAIEKREYYAHRIIWKWMTGNEPPWGVVDHRDRQGLNNRWTNLRLGTYSQSQGNQGRANGQSGVKGVYIDKRREGFYAMFRGKRLGTFKTTEQAHAAYCEAAKAHFGEFWHPG